MSQSLGQFCRNFWHKFFGVFSCIQEDVRMESSYRIFSRNQSSHDSFANISTIPQFIVHMTSLKNCEGICKKTLIYKKTQPIAR